MANGSQFSLKRRENGKALLVEPGYKTKYPSLALLKFSTFLKNNGYAVDYVKGEKPLKEKFDEILITTFFSVDWKKCIDAICYYGINFPDSHINIGGIYASLCPDHVYKHTGIQPYVGCFEQVDECPPDYSLLPKPFFNKTSRILTARGCPRCCEFCGTRILEPELRVINNWRQHLLPESDFAVIHDNNILAHGDDHLLDVLHFFKEKKLKFMFDNGFDCRLFKKNHARMLKNSTITETRFAFDTMEQDGHLQNAISYCKEVGIPASKIKVYVLYNFNDDLEEALYRVKEVHRLGARPYAMRYRPLKWMDPDRIYISEKWDLQNVYDFSNYVNRYFIMKYWSYEEWKEKKTLIMKIKGISAKQRAIERRKMTIENIIFRRIEEAVIDNDNETIFSNSTFINSILNGGVDEP